ncbi:GNAT family N-acetyltransferase [Streptomyces sp. TP-A0874]|uniref:GNAT family N-acetyltransferase n=1 Tax=Streptomyces sp. TP-A0874 TaxID=549819 RepID=UPI00278C23E3|nr:GNAT family N-acetyltransferase [Streptomyces sp. TP-A0874]
MPTAFPGPTPGAFTLRPVDPDTDARLVHGWMNDPEVARFWEMAGPLDRIEAHLRDQSGGGRSVPYLGCLDGEPMSYWELYRADLDPIAEHYPARPHDAGVHLLLGPVRFRGRGLGARLLRAVAAWQLAVDPAAQRVVAEPDVRNVRSVRAFRRAGFRQVRALRLPEKQAVLMIRERGEGNTGEPRPGQVVAHPSEHPRTFQ